MDWNTHFRTVIAKSNAASFGADNTGNTIRQIESKVWNPNFFLILSAAGLGLTILASKSRR
jgi:hypothetical protein